MPKRGIIISLLKYIVPAFAGTILFFSCKTDIETINLLAEHDKIPSVIAKNIEILYTEHGVLRVKILAPESRYYQFEQEPYNEFPQGILVYNYNDSLVLQSQISSNYAIYYEEKKLWIARYNVEATNSKGEVLNTEQLYWDEQNKRIYSDDNVKITTADGVIFGEGFESDENFDNWVIRKTSGIIYVDEN
jgi:LPS export ABC transporter protein LptC